MFYIRHKKSEFLVKFHINYISDKNSKIFELKSFKDYCFVTFNDNIEHGTIFMQNL